MSSCHLQISYSLPFSVTLIDGKLMQHPEVIDGKGEDFSPPEWVTCAARTARGNRCKNYLEFGQETESWGSAKIGGYEVAVRTSERFTPERIDRWLMQLCELHYGIRGRVVYAVQPQWTHYDTAEDIANMDRIVEAVKSLADKLGIECGGWLSE